MPYDKALLMIVNFAGLEFEQKEDVIIVSSREGLEFEQTPDTYAPVTTREVKISAVFFEMDVQEARKIGMDWELLLSGSDANIAGLLRTETESSAEGGEGGVHDGGVLIVPHAVGAVATQAPDATGGQDRRVVGHDSRLVGQIS